MKISLLNYKRRAGNFSLHHRVQPGSGAHHPATYPMATGGSWSEDDYSPQFIAEVKNAWSYTSTSSVCVHSVGLS